MTASLAGREISSSGRMIRFFILLLCASTLFMVCLKITGYGYYPSDDALRHVAKVVSGKEWHDIIVIRDEIQVDSHPGWHRLLSFFHKTAKLSPTNLLNLSAISLFLLFALPPVFILSRPEAWVASLAALVVCSFNSFSPYYRLFIGRPFIFFMFVVVMFCFLWKPIRDKEKPYPELVFFFLLVALATWLQGTWYLLALPLVALLIAREWRVFVLMASAALIGVFTGALLTGSPIAFLEQMVFHLFEVLGHHDLQRQLVTELQPFPGEVITVILVAGLLLWRKAQGDWNSKCVDNPVFFLGVIGWIMGFSVERFWTDWGFPAMAVWVALEFQRVFEKYVRRSSLQRLVLASVLCLVLFLAMTSDRDSRWSSRTMADWPDRKNVDHAAWLPQEGGILYNDSMRVFSTYSSKIRMGPGGTFLVSNPPGCRKTILRFTGIYSSPRENLKVTGPGSTK